MVLSVHAGLAEIQSCLSLTSLEECRLKFFGKSGFVTEQLKTLGSLSPEEKRAKGAEINAIKEELLGAFQQKKEILEAQALALRLSQEALDLTLPCRPLAKGSKHLLTQVIEDIETHFKKQGFVTVSGPELEDEQYNFDALNIPAHHPARQNHDTFYIADHPQKLLRTHTSAAQIRTLLEKKPPLRMLSVGRVYRSDAVDATHSPMFHQVEGLVLEPHVHMGHLKGCLIEFCESFFGVKNLPVRFRPSFFPFTEPSAEMDIGCTRKNDALKIGEGDQWLEILGCGMVHPAVLKNCGVDPETTQGFAFGVGIERLAMLKYGLSDIRAFYENDQRWLSHYGRR